LQENKTAQEAQKKVKTGEKNYWKKLLGITKDMWKLTYLLSGERQIDMHGILKEVTVWQEVDYRFNSRNKKNPICSCKH